MENFEYYTPTRYIFGRGSIEKLPDLLRPLGKRVLLTYGGGSIKRIGLYDKVKDLLKDFEIYELGGIEPNPKYDPSVLEGRKICLEKQIDVVLSVGGGSVLDCSKAICGVSKTKGDAWEIISGKIPTTGALPLVDIITLSATGSEYDSGGVITNLETHEKIGYANKYLFPVASICDPTYVFSVNKYQTAAGVADAINHCLEDYFCDSHTRLSDDMLISTMRSLMVNGPKAIINPSDYESRGEIMIACSLACNGILSLGNSFGGWPMHAIEHELSAYYDITHGVGLALITPRWMKKILQINPATKERLVYLGVNLFSLSEELSEEEIAKLTIDCFFSFFEQLGIPMYLDKVGVPKQGIEEMVNHLYRNNRMLKGFTPLEKIDVREILLDCYK